MTILNRIKQSATCMKERLCKFINKTLTFCAEKIYITAGCWLFMYFSLIAISFLFMLATGNPVPFIFNFFATSFFISMRWL